jgi:hypothetical protein
MVHARRPIRLAVALATVSFVGLVSVARAESIPDREVSRDMVRHALLDTCVYGESAKEGAKKDKVVDACQCASAKVVKTVKDEDISKVAESKAVPDAWFSATSDAFAACKR